MEDQEKNEQLRFGISRYDHYYDSVNNKGNAFLALNTFLLAGVLAAYYTLKLNPAWWYKASFVLILALNVAVTAATLWALRPSLSKGYTNSRFWFGDVSCITSAEYSDCWANVTSQAINQDLTKQMHALACGLRKKFHWLGLATYGLLVQIALVTIMGFINLK